MDSVVVPTIIANLAATGCSLLLLRRGPTRRLKLLALTVGLMSLAQTSAFLHSQGIWTGGTAQVAGLHQSLAACLSLLAIYLLGREIYDRNYTDKKLRLAEFESARPVAERAPERRKLIRTPAVPTPAVVAGMAPAPLKDEQERKRVVGPADTREIHQASTRAATDLLLLLSAVSEDGKPVAGPAGESTGIEDKQCEQCLDIVRNIAGAWLEICIAREMNEPNLTLQRVARARERLARTLKLSWRHEIECGHSALGERDPSHPTARTNGTLIEFPDRSAREVGA